MAKNLEAARALDRAAERHPLVGADSLYEAIGTIYLAEGDLDKASDAFQARVDVGPPNNTGPIEGSARSCCSAAGTTRPWQSWRWRC